MESRWVLLAEDDDDIRSMIRETLQAEAEGLNMTVQVVEAKDGIEALGKASGRQFHCVVTDLRMPRSTGEEFIRSMLADPLNANTPTLIVSGHTREEFAEFCDKYGHIKVIPKPFEPQMLAQAVIREIRLGPMDTRVSLHLMNPFLGGIQRLVTTEMKTTCELANPAVKKTGEMISGDIHCTLTFATPVSRAKFTLSFDKGFLEQARANFLQAKVATDKFLPLDHVARTLVGIIFDRVAPQLEPRMGGIPRLVGLSMATYRDESALAELQAAGGAMVEVSTDQGIVIAAALAKPKTRRL